MVSIPKISPNLLIGAAILGAIFLITREIRGAGQDLARSLGEGVLSNVQLPTLPTVTAPDFSGLFDFLKGQQQQQQAPITINLPQPITQQGQLAPPPLQIIDPNVGGLQRDIDALRKQLEQQAPSVPIVVKEIPPIVDPNTGQRPKTADELIALLDRLKGTQPSNLFGVGFLGKGRQGISNIVAQRLGLISRSESQISPLQKRRLQTFSPSDTVFSKFAQNVPSLNRFLRSFRTIIPSESIFSLKPRSGLWLP